MSFAYALEKIDSVQGPVPQRGKKGSYYRHINHLFCLSVSLCGLMCWGLSISSHLLQPLILISITYINICKLIQKLLLKIITKIKNEKVLIHLFMITKMFAIKLLEDPQ